MPATYIYDAVRTPFGRAGGALSAVRPDDLAAVVMKAAVERTGLDPARIDDVIFGDANQAGEDNRDVARFGALLAGFPSSVPGVTVNRLCGSSVEAVIQGSRAIEAGDADIILAGGVESMSRAPFVVEKPAKPFPAVGNQTMWNTSIGWRMTNPALRKDWTISNGESAEKLAQIYGISRDEQDAFALRSHRLAAQAWADGRLRRRDRAGRRSRAGARRRHPRRHQPRGARRPARAVRRGRHRHRGQLLADQRRRVRGPARRRRGAGCRAARPHHRPRRLRQRPRRVRRRAGRGRQPRARPRRSHLGRRRLRRAQRGLRVAVARVPAAVDRARPREASTSTAARSRSATRSAPPAAASSATPPTNSPAAAAASRSPRSASASDRDSPSSSNGSAAG